MRQVPCGCRGPHPTTLALPYHTMRLQAQLWNQDLPRNMRSVSDYNFTLSEQKEAITCIGWFRLTAVSCWLCGSAV